MESIADYLRFIS